MNSRWPKCLLKYVSTSSIYRILLYGERCIPSIAVIQSLYHTQDVISLEHHDRKHMKVQMMIL